jgi:cell division transport system permease protein
MRAQFVFSEVWVGLRRNLTMTVALVVVVAISLSLLGTGLLFMKQVREAQSFWQSRAVLPVYLCSSAQLSAACKNGPVTAAEQQQIYSTLIKLPGVEKVTYQSQAAAYAQFKQEFANLPVFIQFTPASDISASFGVKLANAQADWHEVQSAMNGVPGVQNVGDVSVLSNLYNLFNGARNAVIAVAVILIVAAILLVANTIRLSAFNRRRETAIMRLVGASNFYVQLPFLVEGMIAGLFGWIVAVGLLAAARAGLDGMQVYFPFPVTLSMVDLIEVVIITMLIALVLCGSTSFLTLRRYLRV